MDNLDIFLSQPRIQRSTRKGYAASVRRQSRQRLRSVCESKRRGKKANAVFAASHRLTAETELSGLCPNSRNPIEAQRSGFDWKRKDKRSVANSRRKPGVSGAQFVLTRGCTGFDGGMEAGQAGGGA